MKYKVDENSAMVYSTAEGNLCPSCGKARMQCVCSKTVNAIKGDGPVHVGRETKGRKGKGVTVVSGLALSAAALQELAKALKQKCGAGGTIKDNVIEIQGDHRDAIVAELIQRGYKAKKSGG